MLNMLRKISRKMSRENVEQDVEQESLAPLEKRGRGRPKCLLKIEQKTKNRPER